jgi:hypothetical protein
MAAILVMAACRARAIELLLVSTPRIEAKTRLNFLAITPAGRDHAGAFPNAVGRTCD